MAEPFFVAGPQLWSAMPMPSFGYFPPIPGNRPPMIANPPLDPGPSIGANWPSVAPTPISSSVAIPSMPEFAVGILPQALLAAVAMRRGQPMGPTNDQEIEEFLSDVLDLLPGANDVEVRCESGRATLTGAVAHKRLKRDAGEVAWAIPSVNDVQNNISIAARRRSRASTRDVEPPAASGPGRKQT